MVTRKTVQTTPTAPAGADEAATRRTDDGTAGHPLSRRHYRVGTAAIEQMVDLVMHCLKVRIPGTLVYARPRMGKTHAIDYVTLHLARHCADVLVLRLSWRVVKLLHPPKAAPQANQRFGGTAVATFLRIFLY